MMPSSGDAYSKFSYATRNILCPVGTAQVREPFPYHLAFSMTVHKTQDHTIGKVIVDLTFQPNLYSQLGLAAVFVAMSRVKS